MKAYSCLVFLLLALSVALVSTKKYGISKEILCHRACRLYPEDAKYTKCISKCNKLEDIFTNPKKKEAVKYFMKMSDDEVQSDSVSMGAMCATTAVNVRSCASTGCGVMTTLSNGAAVNAVGDGGYSNGYSWKKIVGSFGTGYAVANYLGNCGSSTQCTNTGSNIRSGPGTGYGIVTSVSSGAQLSVHGDAGSANGYSWKLVSGSFGTGFIASSLLQSCGGSPQPPQPSGGDMSYDQLKAIMPYANSNKLREYSPYLNAAMREGSINTCLRRSAFIAQLAHESGSLVYMEEIADGSAYEGRRDLGNTQPGDGKRYKGRGPIQLTGRANYRSAGAALGLDLEGNPWQAASKEVGFRIAQWYWSTRGLNSYADQGTQAGFDTITKRVNGGYNGKASRDSFYWTARRVLGC